MDNAKIQLYDLSTDIHEDRNLASQQTKVLNDVGFMEEASTSPKWITPRSQKNKFTDYGHQNILHAMDNFLSAGQRMAKVPR